MKTFVLIVTFAATTDLLGGARTERIASFDDYEACVLAGRTLYPPQHWECVPTTSIPKRHRRAVKACCVQAGPGNGGWSVMKCRQPVTSSELLPPHDATLRVDRADNLIVLGRICYI